MVATVRGVGVGLALSPTASAAVFPPPHPVSASEPATSNADRILIFKRFSLFMDLQNRSFASTFLAEAACSFLHGSLQGEEVVPSKCDPVKPRVDAASEGLTRAGRPALLDQDFLFRMVEIVVCRQGDFVKIGPIECAVKPGRPISLVLMPPHVP
ncbi:MAG TPA: hypothetical protein DEQ49_13870 [Arthrobacter bacterium]|jgi:hypothetical protein|nr:hypothetical protein [Arthrobacter sp.]